MRFVLRNEKPYQFAFLQRPYCNLYYLFCIMNAVQVGYAKINTVIEIIVTECINEIPRKC